MSANGLHNPNWFGGSCVNSDFAFSPIVEGVEDEIHQRHFLGNVFIIQQWCISVVCLWNLDERSTHHNCKLFRFYPNTVKLSYPT
jgi:hypothetical protein